MSAKGAIQRERRKKNCCCSHTWFMFFRSLVYSSNTSGSSGVTPVDVGSVRLSRGGLGRSWLLCSSIITVVGLLLLLRRRRRRRRALHSVVFFLEKVVTF